MLRRSIILLAMTALANGPLFAVTLTVTNTNDSGDGSLRQAIIDSNASVGVLDTITFDIPGSGVHTIQPITALPSITDPVTIDGYTQPGSQTNTLATDDNAVLLIELSGASAPSNVSGLLFQTGNSIVRGLVIDNWNFVGVRFLVGDGNAVRGCFVGTNADASAAAGNGQGVLCDSSGSHTIGGTLPADRNIISGSKSFSGGIVLGGAGTLIEGNFIGTDRHGTAAIANVGDGIVVNSNSSQTTIGGTVAGAGNVISGNANRGISATAGGAVDLVIQGNLIGTDVTGTADLGNNHDGIVVFGGVGQGGALIGGGTAAARNVISGNGFRGLVISGAPDCIVQGNFIGTGADGTSDLGNDLAGVSLQGTSATLLGGLQPGEGNVIAFNAVAQTVGIKSGVNVTSGTGNSIQGNSISSNGGLGIDLGGPSGNGVTPNDPGDGDDGPNQFQNSPVLTSVTEAGGLTTITGNLNSTANTAFHIELFANDAIDPSGFGEGQTLVATKEVIIPAGSNDVSFSVTVPQIATGSFVTATATDSLGNTSEFSPASGTGAPVITSPLSVAVTAGQLFVYQFEATGATTLAVSILPDGLTFDPSISAIVGTPTVTGAFRVELSATNSGGTTTAILTLTLQSAPSSGPVIISRTSATGRTGQPFRFQVITSGGTFAERLSATGLPPGLSVDAVTGVISGTPATDGSFAVLLTVTEGNLTTTGTLELTFTSDLAVPVIVSPSSATLVPGQPFIYTIDAPSSADPSTDPTIFDLVGTLPPGLSFDATTGVISGTFQARAVSAPSPQLSGGIVTNVQLFATNSHGTGTIPLVFFIAPSGALNISTRLSVGLGDDVLIGGFIVTGNAPKQVLIRAIGPSLQSNGVPVPGTVQDPTLELYDSTGLLATNDNWRDSQEQEIIDTTIPPTDDREAAIVATLDLGAYTAIVRGKDNSTGIGLVEVYDLGTAAFDISTEAQLANISTRGKVGTGDDVMIGGFILGGDSTIVARGIGPSLTAAGVPGALADPTLELHDSSGAIVSSNDNWKDSPDEQTIIDNGLPPSDDKESALLVTLAPGAYTAILRGVNNTTGVALVEAYNLQ